MPVVLKNLSQRVEVLHQIDISDQDADDKYLLRSFFVQCEQDVLLAWTNYLRQIKLLIMILPNLSRIKPNILKPAILRY